MALLVLLVLLALLALLALLVLLVHNASGWLCSRASANENSLIFDGMCASV